MIKEYILNFYKENTGATWGAFIGLVTAVLILTIGLFRTLFIAIFICIGYYIGKRMSYDKEYIRRFFDKMLPPGTYR